MSEEQEARTVELHDGSELEVDLHRITILEWRTLFDEGTDQDTEDEILGKVVGLGGDEIGNLPQPDYRRVMRVVLDAATRPLDDPKSQSGSSSD